MTNVTIEQASVANLFNIQVPKGVLINKFSNANHPQIPTATSEYVFRKELVREMRDFLMTPRGDAMFLSGPTGSGKTSLVTEFCARLNWPVQEITCNGRMEVADMIGHHALVSPAPGQTPVMQFMHGPLAVAMKEGHVLLLNEIDMLDPAELSGLNDVLEGRPLVIAQNGGEVIKPHPSFRVIATGNSLGSGDATGLYQGVSMQSMAAMDRFRFMIVGYADPEVEEGILTKESPDLGGDIIKSMVRLANEVRALFMGEGDSGGELSITMSTRVLRRWARLAIAFRSSQNAAGERNALSYALHMAMLRRASPEEQTAVLQLAKSIFGDSWHD